MVHGTCDSGFSSISLDYAGMTTFCFLCPISLPSGGPGLDSLGILLLLNSSAFLVLTMLGSMSPYLFHGPEFLVASNSKRDNSVRLGNFSLLGFEGLLMGESLTYVYIPSSA